MGEKQGVTAAIEAIGPGEPPAAAGQQAELFDNAAAPVPLAPSAGRSGPQGGRPAGSRNRRTQEWVDFILAQYRSPLIVLAETYSRPVEDLARELGCNKLEAFERQQAAAVALAPYLHQRQPQAIEVASQSRGLLLIGELASDGTADGLAIPFAEVVENQALSHGDPDKSDGGNSRTDAKPLSNKDNSADGQ